MCLVPNSYDYLMKEFDRQRRKLAPQINWNLHLTEEMGLTAEEALQAGFIFSN
jgi:hypothetical protein